MAYVRRVDGEIRASYSGPQKSCVTEPISDSDPELLAFYASLVPSIGDEIEKEITGSNALSAMVRRIAKSEDKTEREIIDEIRAEAKGGQ